MAVVVLPPPPSRFAIAITGVTGASPRIRCGVGTGRRSGGGMALGYSSRPVGERRGYPQIGRLVHLFVDMSSTRRRGAKPLVSCGAAPDRALSLRKDRVMGSDRAHQRRAHR